MKINTLKYINNLHIGNKHLNKLYNKIYYGHIHGTIEITENKNINKIANINDMYYELLKILRDPEIINYSKMIETQYINKGTLEIHLDKREKINFINANTNI